MDHNEDSKAAGGVLDPIALEHFFEQYWEQKPLYIERSSSNPFEHLISIEAIESLLSTNSLSSQIVQLSHAGKRIPIDNYTDENGLVIANRIVEGYKNGSTIIVSQAHRLIPELMNLCRDIQSSFLMRCQTNLYLSPAGNQGFNPHYDTHDVFILQISGAKKFNFYSKRTEHPTAADRFNENIHEVGDKTESVMLSAGDTLYIPRGVVHDAVADAEETSLHITLGVYPILLHTLLEEVLQDAVATDSRLRRSLPQALWLHGRGIENMTQLLLEVLSTKLNDDGVSKALLQLRDDMALDSHMNMNGSLARVRHAQEVQSATIAPRDLSTAKLSLNRGAILHIERLEQKVLLRTFGQVVELPDPYGKALEGLIEQDYFELYGLKILTDEQQITFIQKLLSVDIIMFD